MEIVVLKTNLYERSLTIDTVDPNLPCNVLQLGVLLTLPNEAEYNVVVDFLVANFMCGL